MNDADKMYLAERGADVLVAADAILVATAKFRCVDEASRNAIMEAVKVMWSVRKWISSGDCITQDYMRNAN